MNFTGKYGIVLLPDAETKKRAIELSKSIVPNAIDLGGADHVHATNYHADFLNMPEQEVGKILDMIAVQLPILVGLYRLDTFRKKYAFWDINPTEELKSLHMQTLALSRFLNPDSTPVGVGDLDLSKEEKENNRLFGYPLVREQMRPHITVGYNEDGSYEFNKEPLQFDATFDRVAFVKIGNNGTVKEIIGFRAVQ